MAMGMPIEGSAATVPRAGDVARKDVPTCGPKELVGEIRARVRAAGWDACVVVNEERVVLGLFRTRELERADALASVEEAMRPGPSTFRPFVAIEEMGRYMVQHDLPTAPITTSDGRLIGVLRREDALRMAKASEQTSSITEPEA
jgi:Mg/Co/Ni transporter MgtE